jgi:hypothetical protein
MSTPLLLEGTLPRRGRRGAAQAATVSEPSPRVPRIARLVALAWHIEEQVHLGTLASYAAAARLGHVSRARLSQILSLLNLAPDVQEQVLFLQRPIRGRQALTLRQLLSVAVALDWHEQRRRWRKLRRAKPPAPDPKAACGCLS